jgi:AcrR family transcriptional regulator
MPETQSSPAVRNRKTEQSDRTRAALIGVARGFFSERGYANTPTEEIVQAAGVTRGALYHHFRDKQDLFEAVYRDLQDELRDRILDATRVEAEPWERMRAGYHQYLDHSMEPTVQRIVLIDAPSVLGWEHWREIDAEYALGLIRNGLTRAQEIGLLAPSASVEYLSQLMLGVVSEASHMIAFAADVPAARIEIGALVDHFLDSLRA